MRCLARQVAGCFAWLSEQALRLWQHNTVPMNFCNCSSVCCSEEADHERLVALAEVLGRVAERLQGQSRARRSNSMP